MFTFPFIRLFTFFYLHSLSHNHPFYFIFQIIFSAFPLIVVLIFRHRYFVTFVPIISHLLKFLCLFFLYYYLLLLLFFINCGSHCCSCLVIVFLFVAYSLLLPFLYTAIRRFQHPFSIIQAGHWHLWTYSNSGTCPAFPNLLGALLKVASNFEHQSNKKCHVPLYHFSRIDLSPVFELSRSFPRYDIAILDYVYKLILNIINIK